MLSVIIILILEIKQKENLSNAVLINHSPKKRLLNGCQRFDLRPFCYLRELQTILSYEKP